MSSQVKRRKVAVMLALTCAMLLLVSGLGLGARSFVNTQASPGSDSQAGPSKHSVAAPNLGSSAAAVAAKGAGQSSGTGWPAHSTVIHSVHNDVSPPLRSMTIIPPAPGRVEGERENRVRGDHGSSTSREKDPVVQSSFGPLAMPTPLLTFDGVNNRNGVFPPDTNGDVGPNHYVQWVNLSLQVWNKSGTSVFGPANGNTIWSGFGGPCQTMNDGDPIAQYDQLADRWMISQFANVFTNGPYYQCIAVSATADPTGSWNRYAFITSNTKLNDYPHFGVWPDAYYMTANLFLAPSFAWAGTGAYAFDRARMLLGQPATMQLFELPISDWGGMLPSDLDGSTLPPAGVPNTFVEVTDADWDPPNTTADELQFHQFHVDWTVPGNSTFSPTVHVPVAAFEGFACPYFDRRCVPQQGTTVKLDAISDRLMYRLAYRNFGTHESLVVNHTVDASGSQNGYTAVRWYEVRNPRATLPTIYQQGTYAPDTQSRWMASSAMDHDGNMAIGYSVSSSSSYASIAYAGRLAGDPLGQLAQGEATLQVGGGAQTENTYNRWGDYSMLAIDPTDDCTFWFTSEYYQTTSSTAWRTRIGSFKFPTCGQVQPTPTPTTPANTPTSTPTTPANTPTSTPTTSVNTPTPTNTPGGPTPTPCAINFSDVHPEDYYYEPVTYLYCHGIISGYGDGTFKPGNNTTRGQLAKIVVLAEGWPIYTPPAPTFRDVPDNDPFYSVIETAYQHGIISGYACGTGCLEYRPGNNVTRGQLSKIVVLAEGWTPYTPPTPTFVDVPDTDPFYTNIETAYNHGIISGYSCGATCLEFRPGNNATRGQISKIVYLAVTGP